MTLRWHTGIIAQDYITVRKYYQTLNESAPHSFFQSWPWIESWLSAADTAKLRFICLLDNEHPVGIAILGQNYDYECRILPWHSIYFNETGHLATDIVAIEYNQPLIMAEYRRIFLSEFLQHSRHALAIPRWQQLIARRVPIEDVKIWQNITPYDCQIFKIEPSCHIDFTILEKNNQSLSESLSSNTRYQLRRSMKLYEDVFGKLQLDTADNPAMALNWLDEMGKLHAAYWQKKAGYAGAWHYPTIVTILKCLIENYMTNGLIEIVRLKAGDHIVGYIGNFIYQNTIYFYICGFDYQTNPHMKPGLMAHFLCAEKHQKQGRLVYDFMAGDQRYKASLSNGKTELYSLTLRRPDCWQYHVSKLLQHCKNTAYRFTKHAS